jgi:hypothetical protein
MQHHLGFGGAGVNLLSLAIAVVYWGLVITQLAKRTNTQAEPWMCWVPIVNFWVLTQIAGKEPIWFILLIIPCVGFFAAVPIWMAIAEKTGKPS